MKKYQHNVCLSTEVTPEEHASVKKECDFKYLSIKEWLREAIFEKLENDKDKI
jgi:hypothetical protein